MNIKKIIENTAILVVITVVAFGAWPFLFLLFLYGIYHFYHENDMVAIKRCIIGVAVTIGIALLEYFLHLTYFA